MCSPAQGYFVDGDASQLDTRAAHNLPWFWYEEVSDTLYVDTRRAPLSSIAGFSDEDEQSLPILPSNYPIPPSNYVSRTPTGRKPSAS